MKRLTKDEIEDVAIRLDGIIGDEFYDAICSIVFERGSEDFEDISDEDIFAIKEHLKSIL